MLKYFLCFIVKVLVGSVGIAAFRMLLDAKTVFTNMFYSLLMAASIWICIIITVWQHSSG